MIPMLCGWYKFCKPPHPGCGQGLPWIAVGRGKVLLRTRGHFGARKAFKAVLLPREVLILLKHHRQGVEDHPKRMWSQNVVVLELKIILKLNITMSSHPSSQVLCSFQKAEEGLFQWIVYFCKIQQLFTTWSLIWNENLGYTVLLPYFQAVWFYKAMHIFCGLVKSSTVSSLTSEHLLFL